jgi:hypothetical protein
MGEVPRNQQLAHWAKYLRRESHKLYTTGTSKVKLEKFIELAELGFYKKKNGFEVAQGVLDFYNKTFKKTSPVETPVILPHASAEVVHDMEPFAVAEVIDPQEAEESSVTIVKPTKVIYGNIRLRIDMSQTKKAPTQVQKPFAMTLEFAQNSRESPHKVEIPLLKQAADSFVPDMNKRNDIAAAESMYSPFEKQMRDHKQVKQDIFRVKEGDSKKEQVPKYFDDTPSDCKMAEVHVQEDYPISDTTPISKPLISGEHVIKSDYKKAAPSIEGHSPFHEPTKSKGLVDEEVQFVMSQIYISSKKESGTKKRKTEVLTYDFQTPPNISPQRSKFLFETSIHSNNSKKQSGLTGKAGTRTSRETRRSTVIESLDFLHQVYQKFQEKEGKEIP